MRKLVFITQVVDPDDPNLGATCAKIAALARRVDEVAVLCDRARDGALPENCRVHVFGAPSRRQRASPNEDAASAPTTRQWRTLVFCASAASNCVLSGACAISTLARESFSR